MRGVNPNPYESPQFQRNEGKKRQWVPWSRIGRYGFIVFAASIPAIMTVPVFSYIPAKHPVFAAVHNAVVLAGLVGAACGAVAAVVGGIGHLLRRL